MALTGYIYKRAVKLVGLEDPLVDSVMSATSVAYRCLANIIILTFVYSVVMTVFKAFTS